MTAKREKGVRTDAILIIVAVIVLAASVWVWMLATSIAKEVVFLATTIALVISLILVVNIVFLVLLRLQKRITDLEDKLSEKDEEPSVIPEERVIVVTLTNTERRVLNRLEENGGKMTQDELRRATGLSKSTLSVTLSTLERKSLITREISGRTKIVILIQKVPR